MFPFIYGWVVGDGVTKGERFSAALGAPYGQDLIYL